MPRLDLSVIVMDCSTLQASFPRGSSVHHCHCNRLDDGIRDWNVRQPNVFD
jgi:hypothetical protein